MIDVWEGLDSVFNFSAASLCQNQYFRPLSRERARQGRAGRHQARTAAQILEEQYKRFEKGREKFNAKLSGSRDEVAQHVEQEKGRLNPRKGK